MHKKTERFKVINRNRKINIETNIEMNRIIFMMMGKEIRHYHYKLCTECKGNLAGVIFNLFFQAVQGSLLFDAL